MQVTSVTLLTAFLCALVAVHAVPAAAQETPPVGGPYFEFECARNGTTWTQWNLCTSSDGTKCYGHNVISVRGEMVDGSVGYDVCNFAVCVGWYCTDGRALIQNYRTPADDPFIPAGYNQIVEPNAQTGAYNGECFCAPPGVATGDVPAQWDPLDEDQNDALHTVPGGLNYRYDDAECVAENYACDDITQNLFRRNGTCYCCPDRDQPYYYFPISTPMCRDPTLAPPTTTTTTPIHSASSSSSAPPSESSAGSSSSSSVPSIQSCGLYRHIPGGCGWEACEGRKADADQSFCQLVALYGERDVDLCAESVFPCSGLSCPAGHEVVFDPWVDDGRCQCLDVSSGCPAGVPVDAGCAGVKQLSCGFVNCEGVSGTGVCEDLTPAQEASACSRYRCENRVCPTGLAMVFDARKMSCKCHPIREDTMCQVQSSSPLTCRMSVTGVSPAQCGYYDCSVLNNAFCVGIALGGTPSCASSPCAGRRCSTGRETLVFDSASGECRCYTSRPAIALSAGIPRCNSTW